MRLYEHPYIKELELIDVLSESDDNTTDDPEFDDDEFDNEEDFVF